MNLNVNIEYAVREQERLELERRDITLRIAAWVRRCVALSAFNAALTNEERTCVNAEQARRAAKFSTVVATDKPRETSMQQNGKRPSARYQERAEDTGDSERYGRLAGAQDAAELDDRDAEAAWLEWRDVGGPESPAQHAAFTAAYEAEYDRIYTNAGSQPEEQVSHGV